MYLQLNVHALQKRTASVAYMSMENGSANNFKAVYSKQEAHWTRHSRLVVKGQIHSVSIVSVKLK